MGMERIALFCCYRHRVMANGNVWTLLTTLNAFVFFLHQLLRSVMLKMISYVFFKENKQSVYVCVCVVYISFILCKDNCKC